MSGVPGGARGGARKRGVSKLDPYAEQIVALRKESWTLREIADKFGLSISTVCLFLQGKNVQSPRELRGRPPGAFGKLAPHIDEIVDLRYAGWTLQAIADKYGATREAIRVLCDREGVRLPPPLTAYRRLAKAVAVAAKLQIKEENGGVFTLAEHGTLYRSRRGCHCDECRRAGREYQRTLLDRAEPPKHGDSGYVNYGCRCEICSSANSICQKATRKFRVVREQLQGGDMLTLTAFDSYIEAVRDKLSTKTQEQIDELDAQMAIDFDDHYAFQQQQAQAHASGVLSPAAALRVYESLGEVQSGHNGGWSDGVDTATKVAVTKLMGELLGAQIASRSSVGPV